MAAQKLNDSTAFSKYYPFNSHTVTFYVHSVVSSVISIFPTYKFDSNAL